MFNLDRAIAGWRRRLSLREGLTDDDLSELESHVRDDVEARIAEGASEKDAFYAAVYGFGEADELSRKFRLASWEKVATRRTIGAPGLMAHHLRLSFRAVMKHKAHYAINLFGLACGIACVIVVMLFVHDELRYDRFHEGSERIYRVVVDRANAGVVEARVQTPDALGPAMARQFPDVEHAARIMPSYYGKRTLRRGDRSVFGDAYLMVDATFFDVFSFRFLQGNAQSAIASPGSIVITENLSRILFGETEALGKTLLLDQNKTLKVTAVIEDVPRQSHFHFDYLIARPPNWEDCWNANCGHSFTYVKLKAGADPEHVREKIQRLVESNQANERTDVYAMQPLAGLDGIHLNSHRIHELEPNSSRLYVNLLIGATLFLLVIGSINYVNLTTSRSATRAREIGVRRAIGAERRMLIRQLLAESIVMTTIAGVVAVGLAELALSGINPIVDKNLSFFTPGNESVWLLVVASVLLLGLASGMYPALYLSAVRPTAIVRQIQPVSSKRGFFRRGLVVFQFSLACLLIVGAMGVQKQVKYIQSADLGFDRDHVVIIENFGKATAGDVHFAARSSISELVGVSAVGSATDLVGLSNATGWGTLKVRGSEHEISVQAAHVDRGYLDVLGIQLVEGREFSSTFETDTSPLVAIVNETAVRQLGLGSSAVGTKIEDSAGRTSEIIGVVKDFNFSSLRNAIAPFVFFRYPRAGALAVKVRAKDVRRTLSGIEGAWAAFSPSEPMDYYFLDERIEQQYRWEENFRTLFSAVTGLSLLIACLGMLGLVAFTAERRTKEIGIRKAMGASVAHVVTLLSKDFFRLVIIANMIAWPAAYILMDRWLDRFAYHAEIGITIYLVSAITAILVAGMTVGWHAIRAATLDPVESLRYE